MSDKLREQLRRAGPSAPMHPIARFKLFHALWIQRQEALAPFLDDNNPETQAFDTQFKAMAGARAEKEILIALQEAADGTEVLWEGVAAQIKAAPSTWRWWIRPHPPAVEVNAEGPYAALRRVTQPNVMFGDSRFALAAMLRNVDMVVALYSKTGLEAGIFGVPSIFLWGDVARLFFADFIDEGKAFVVDVTDLNAQIARLGSRHSV